ncbi:hypothetical protein BSKO_08122 [Bryopsis sp. KO-2023]|nr:hypothetical protein BSKO_08122 [Bryopsis sp. KO-2023]
MRGAGSIGRPILCAVGPVPRTSVDREVAVPRIGVKRPLWYPGCTPPRHLNGSMAGDYGFDPLSLGRNPNTIRWFREAELMNGRWAMVAVPGVLAANARGCSKFWEVYREVDPWMWLGPLVIVGIFEYYRYHGYKKTGECGLLWMHPFDPLKLRSEEMMAAEVNHGRLAMLSFMGFCSQAAVLGMGPIESLMNHLENPFQNNVYTTSEGEETMLMAILLSIWPMISELERSSARSEPPPKKSTKNRPGEQTSSSRR